MKKLDLPPLWTLLTLVSIALINRFVPNPNLSEILRPWISYILFAYGAYLIIWSALTLRKHKTTIHPRHRAKQLVTTGPFAISRNPIYTGMILIAMGAAILGGSIYGALPVIGLFFVLKQRFVEPEERSLIEEFGEEAQDYVARTRRW